MKKRSIFLLLFLGGSTLWAASPGTVGFSFLRTQVGARAAGMGGALLAIPGDLHSIYYNPAGLIGLKTPMAGATYLNHVLDLNSGFIGYAHPLDRWGVVGLSVLYADYGSFKKTDATGQEIGDFGANSIALAASYATDPLPNLGAGLNVKFIHSAIDNYNASALAVDGGVVYSFPDQDLHLAIGFYNLGEALNAFIAEKEELPFHYKVGFAKKLAHLPLLFSFNLYKFVHEDWHGAVGGEFQLSDRMFLRLGYDHLGQEMQVGTSKDRFAGAAIGFGLLFKQFAVDYSLTSHGEIGFLNRFSLVGSI
ncbi:MAG TPA: PorV/PorQ family protein [bacterium]|nr:PorV/PorQ family protein [bacterium]HPG44828.1 PorV/PorQ family protein [bacterium]HPM98143.1 PorV/PorQ family protein [bacterium]